MRDSCEVAVATDANGSTRGSRYSVASPSFSCPNACGFGSRSHGRHEAADDCCIAPIVVVCEGCGDKRTFAAAVDAAWRFRANADPTAPDTLRPLCPHCARQRGDRCKADRRFCKACGTLEHNDAFDYRDWDKDGANPWCGACTTWGMF